MTSRLYDPQRAHLQPRVYSDASVFAAEINAIFGRTWLAIGHESQAPRPGDFIVSRMAVDPVLLWRGMDGELRVFLNFCPLSGSRLCFAEVGHGAEIECRCNGLLFGSDGVVAGGAAELARVDRVDSFHGLIFATHAAAEADVAEYLGDFAFYLEPLLAERSVVTSPMKAIFDTNWKLPMDAFMSGLAVENDRRPIEPEPLDDLVQVQAGPGGLAGTWDGDGGFRAMRGALFPNLMLSWAESALHIVMPRGARETEVWSILLTDGASSPQQQQETRMQFIQDFAVTSPVFEDLAMNWQNITRVSKSREARTYPAIFEAGLGQERYHEELPGLVAAPTSEMNQRAFYERWQTMLAGSDSDPPA